MPEIEILLKNNSSTVKIEIGGFSGSLIFKLISDFRKIKFLTYCLQENAKINFICKFFY